MKCAACAVECKDPPSSQQRWVRQCHACHLAWALARDIAHGVCTRAIQRGRVPHPSTFSCVDCGAPAYGYDHRQYAEPLTVDPTCRRCNAKRGPADPLPKGWIPPLTTEFRRQWWQRAQAVRDHAPTLSAPQRKAAETPPVSGRYFSFRRP